MLKFIDSIRKLILIWLKISILCFGFAAGQDLETVESRPQTPASRLSDAPDQLPVPESLKNVVSDVSTSDVIESGEETR